MNVSIIIPLHKPDERILREILDSLKTQKFSGKKEIILVNKGLGLADSMNYGIKNAKYNTLVTLHQDCVPSSDNWLTTLTSPLKKNTVVGCASKVELPYEFWNLFDPIAKILSVKEQQVRLTRMDEKGCAYRKNVLGKLGFFNSTQFRTAGEDFAMFLKLSKIGEIAFTDAKVFHYHKHTWNNRLRKEIQLSNGFGAAVRIYRKEMPWRYRGFIRALPVLGWPFFLYGLNVKKLGFELSLLAIPINLMINLLYSYGFWKGFLMGRQTV